MKRKNIVAFALVLNCCTISQQSFNNQYADEAKEAEVEIGKSIWKAYTQVVLQNKRKKLDLRWLWDFDVPGKKRYYTYEEVKAYIDTTSKVEDKKKFNDMMIYYNKVDSAKLGKSKMEELFSEKDIYGNITRIYKIEDTLIYYVNYSICDRGNDYISSDGCREKYKYQIEREFFGVGNDLVNLVMSPHYVNNENKSEILPTIVKAYANSSFSDVKSILPDPIKKKVDNVPLIIGNSSLGSHRLWLEVVDKKVYISPFLVRAAFIMACNRYPNIMKEYQALSEGKSRLLRINTAEDYRSINSAVLSEMHRNLNFPLGHELAHIYLNKKSTLKDESSCDCHSLYYLKKSKHLYSLDFFNQTLKGAVDSGGRDFWGFEEVGDLKARFAQIDEISIQDTFKCK